MAKLPGWMKVVETKDKGRTVVIVIRWWHPYVWGILWAHSRQQILERGRNPNHMAMRWLAVKTVVRTVWEQSSKTWKFD